MEISVSLSDDDDSDSSANSVQQEPYRGSNLRQDGHNQRSGTTSTAKPLMRAPPPAWSQQDGVPLNIIPPPHAPSPYAPIASPRVISHTTRSAPGWQCAKCQENEECRRELAAARAAAQDAHAERTLVEQQVRRLESEASEGGVLLKQQTASLKHASDVVDSLRLELQGRDELLLQKGKKEKQLKQELEHTRQEHKEMSAMVTGEVKKTVT